MVLGRDAKTSPLGRPNRRQDHRISYGPGLSPKTDSLLRMDTMRDTMEKVACWHRELPPIAAEIVGE